MLILISEAAATHFAGSPLGFGFRVSASSALLKEYQRESVSTLLVKIEIFGTLLPGDRYSGQ
jgi:hypothetical protein